MNEEKLFREINIQIFKQIVDRKRSERYSFPSTETREIQERERGRIVSLTSHSLFLAMIHCYTVCRMVHSDTRLSISRQPFAEHSIPLRASIPRGHASSCRVCNLRRARVYRIRKFTLELSPWLFHRAPRNSSEFKERGGSNS